MRCLFVHYYREEGQDVFKGIGGIEQGLLPSEVR